ncbi:MAG: hypothetical protein K0R57_1577 [Paenibacillaceae bacterium]|nr:hypothetical protein [Paenibacillaceae bacterium]
MKIYQMTDKDCIYTYPDGSEDYDKYRHKFNGKPMEDIWSPVEVEYIHNPPKKEYDCTAFGNGKFIFNDKAIHALNHILQGKVEILPLVHINAAAPKSIFAINVIRMLDCLDYDRAKVKIDPEYKIITEIKRYAFKEEMLRDETIFKMPQHRGTRVFVTEKFVRAVEENHLTGLEFDEVWDSEEDPTAVYTIPIPQFTGETCSFSEALKILREGKYAVASKHFKVQLEGNEMVVGMMDISGEYHWATSYGIPPAFLDMMWYKVERDHIKKMPVDE